MTRPSWSCVAACLSPSTRISPPRSWTLTARCGLSQRDSIPGEAMKPEIVESFRRSYPFHPEVLDTLTGKTATLANFQRVRGMLRLLARTVGHLWDTTAV